MDARADGLQAQIGSTSSSLSADIAAVAAALAAHAALIASQAEAEAGTENTKMMTALRVAQAAPRASQAQAEAGTDNVALMTPLRSAQSIAKLAKPLFKHIGSDTTMTNNMSVQPWFPGAPDFTVEANTAYQIECLSRVTVTAARGFSCDVYTSFAGTATVASIFGIIDSAEAASANIFTSAAEMLLSVTLNINNPWTAKMRATLRTGANAGTFRPQIRFGSSNPGTATIKAGTYFELRKLGAADYAGNA